MKTIICGEKREAMQDMSLCLDDAVFKTYAKMGNDKLTLKAKQDGYLEGEKYIMLWAAGHLFKEIMPADIRPEWGLGQLMSSPKDYLMPELKNLIKKIPDKAKLKQIKTLKTFLARTDYDTFIHAGDADDEGEAIVRDIIEFCMPAARKKSVKFLRFFNPGSFKVASSINKAMSELLPLDDKKFVCRAYSQEARSKSDYIAGLKATKAGSDFGGGGKVLSMGRVQSFVLDVVFRRDQEIELFEKNGPKKFYTIKGTLGDVELKHYYGAQKGETTIKEWQYSNKEIAAGIVDKINNDKNTVKILKYDKKEVVSQSRPLPLSGDDFAKEMMKSFPINYKQSNAILKELRDQGYTTYDGTDGNYFALSDKDEVIAALATCIEYFKSRNDYISKRVGNIAHNDNAGLYNDKAAALQNHTPLCVTTLIPTDETIKKWENSSTRFLKEGYELIAKRILVHFLENDLIAKENLVVVSRFKNHFEAFSETAIKQGWRTFLEQEKTAGGFGRAFTVGAVISLDSVVLVEGKTKKPKKYKIRDILNLMINISEWFDEQISEEEDLEKKEELKKYRKAIKNAKGIGTRRTRSNILDSLSQREMITIGSTGVVDITEYGLLCNAATPAYLKSVVTTALWETKFDEIRRGVYSHTLFIDEVDANIQKWVIPGIYNYFKEHGFNRPKKKSEVLETSMICPLCVQKGELSNKLVMTDTVYKCSTAKYNAKTKKRSGCAFFILKEQKFGDRVLGNKDIIALLRKESVVFGNGNSIVLDLENKFFLKTSFANKEGGGGGGTASIEFKENEKTFTMNGRFIWKKFFDYAFSHEEAKKLLDNKEIDIELISKAGTPYTVTIWWEEEEKKFKKTFAND